MLRHSTASVITHGKGAHLSHVHAKLQSEWHLHALTEQKHTSSNLTRLHMNCDTILFYYLQPLQQYFYFMGGAVNSVQLVLVT